MILTNQVIVSEQFNKYFVTFAQNLVDNIGETTNKFQDYLKNLNKHRMFAKEVERDMVKHELRVESLKGRVEIQKCEFRSTSYNFESMSYEFKSTSYEFKSTS